MIINRCKTIYLILLFIRFSIITIRSCLFENLNSHNVGQKQQWKHLAKFFGIQSQEDKQKFVSRPEVTAF